MARLVMLVVLVVACSAAIAGSAQAANNVPAAVQCPQSPHCWAGTVTMTEVIDSTVVEGCCTMTMKANNTTTVNVSGAGLIVEHESPTGATVLGGEIGPGSAKLDFDNTMTNANCPVGTGTRRDRLFGSVDGDGRALVVANDDDHPTAVTIAGAVDANLPTTQTQECAGDFLSTPQVSGGFTTQAVVALPADWDGQHLSGTATEHVGDYIGTHDRIITWNLTRALRPGCPAVSFRTDCATGPGPDPDHNHAPDDNHAPVATNDAWTVDAGHSLDENVLRNDSDPDGDPITAHVLRISFAAKEYSGVEGGGDFLYTAGPGTTRSLRKVITYEVVDSKGAHSAPATAVITLRVPDGSSRAPGARAAAGTQPVWKVGAHLAWNCQGSGLKTKCWYLESVANTAAFNREKTWTPDLNAAARYCTKYGIVPLKNSDCARKLFDAGVNALWDRGSIADAARFGGCLLYRVSRHRTLAHPLAGEWGKPEYHPLDSTVRPYDRTLSATTGYAKWKKDGATTERWRLPLFCRTDGRVASGINVALETA